MKFMSILEFFLMVKYRSKKIYKAAIDRIAMGIRIGPPFSAISHNEID